MQLLLLLLPKHNKVFTVSSLPLLQRQYWSVAWKGKMILICGGSKRKPFTTGIPETSGWGSPTPWTLTSLINNKLHLNSHSPALPTHPLTLKTTWLRTWPNANCNSNHKIPVFTVNLQQTDFINVVRPAAKLQVSHFSEQHNQQIIHSAQMS